VSQKSNHPVANEHRDYQKSGGLEQKIGGHPAWSPLH
jgi:hypothetical protein